MTYSDIIEKVKKNVCFSQFTRQTVYASRECDSTIEKVISRFVADRNRRMRWSTTSTTYKLYIHPRRGLFLLLDETSSNQRSSACIHVKWKSYDDEYSNRSCTICNSKRESWIFRCTPSALNGTCQSRYEI